MRTSELVTGSAKGAATTTFPSALIAICATSATRQVSRCPTWWIIARSNQSRKIMCQPAPLPTTLRQSTQAATLKTRWCLTRSWTNSSLPWESASCTSINTSIHIRCSHRDTCKDLKLLQLLLGITPLLHKVSNTHHQPHCNNKPTQHQHLHRYLQGNQCPSGDQAASRPDRRPVEVNGRRRND